MRKYFILISFTLCATSRGATLKEVYSLHFPSTERIGEISSSQSRILVQLQTPGSNNSRIYVTDWGGKMIFGDTSKIVSRGHSPFFTTDRGHVVAGHDGRIIKIDADGKIAFELKLPVSPEFSFPMMNGAIGLVSYLASDLGYGMHRVNADGSVDLLESGMSAVSDVLVPEASKLAVDPIMILFQETWPGKSLIRAYDAAGKKLYGESLLLNCTRFLKTGSLPVLAKCGQVNGFDQFAIFSPRGVYLGAARMHLSSRFFPLNDFTMYWENDSAFGFLDSLGNFVRPTRVPQSLNMDFRFGFEAHLIADSQIVVSGYDSSEARMRGQILILDPGGRVVKSYETPKLAADRRPQVIGTLPDGELIVLRLNPTNVLQESNLEIWNSDFQVLYEKVLPKGVTGGRWIQNGNKNQAVLALSRVPAEFEKPGNVLVYFEVVTR